MVRSQTATPSPYTNHFSQDLLTFCFTKYNSLTTTTSFYPSTHHLPPVPVFSTISPTFRVSIHPSRSSLPSLAKPLRWLFQPHAPPSGLPHIRLMHRSTFRRNVLRYRRSVRCRMGANGVRMSGSRRKRGRKFSE